jgi:hypothetical protein
LVVLKLSLIFNRKQREIEFPFHGFPLIFLELLLLLEAALHFGSILEGHRAVEETVGEEFSLTCLGFGLVFI